MSSFDAMELKWKTLAIIAAITISSVRSNEHIVRLANSSFNVRCVGEGNLTWNFQPEHLVNNFKDLLQSNETISERGERTHRGRAMVHYKPQRFELKINNSQIEDTGTYLCYENGVLKSSTHVYINDGTCDNLFVPLNVSAKNLAVHFGQDFVIPCRTTKPDVPVVLEDPQGVDQTIYDYNPTKGFLLKNASLQNHNGFWTCKASYPECEGKDEQDFLVDLIVSDVIKPEILDVGPKIIRVGDAACINCRIITQETRGKLQWMNPNKNIITSFGRFGIQESENRGGRDIDPYTFTSVLSINNVTGLDEGEYICFIMGHQNWNTSIKLEVLDEKRTIRLEIEETARIFITNESDLVNTDEIKWAVSHYPSDIHFKWFNTTGGEIKNSSKYKMYNAVTNKKQKIFTIQDPTLEDSGVYKVVAFTKEASEELNLTLLINSKPKVKIVSGVDFYRPGSTYKMDCRNSAYPPANFSWDFKCLEKNRTIDCEKFHELVQDRLLLKNQPRTSAKSGEFVMTANKTGILSCKACNMMGCAETQSVMVVTDIEDGSVIKSSLEKIYEGDDVSFACFVPKHPCERRWEWTCQYNSSVPATILLTGPNLKIANSQDQYSYSSEVKFKGISGRQNGNYICKAVCVNGKGENLTQKYALSARKIELLHFRNLDTKAEKTVTEGTLAELDCEAHSDPPPSVIWTFKDELIVNSNTNQSHRYAFSPGRMTLQIMRVLTDDEGEYKCTLKSRAIVKTRKFSLSVKSKKWSPVVLIPIAIILVLLLAVVIYLWHAVKKEQRKVQRLTGQEVKLFLEGATENIDHSLALDQQADLLPYNPNYEYPRENLKLGRQLGSGAFGRVLRGEASTPLFGATTDFDCPHEEDDPNNPTIVAVKMVKPNAELSQIKALMTELKILIHVGKHLNVVNLLGACTTNLCNKELLVIVEYCKYGNLHTYLLRQRDNYVDQVNHLKDLLDFSIGTKDDDVRHYQNQSVIMEQKQVLFKKETRTVIYDPQPEVERYHGEATSTTDGSTVTEHWTTKYRSDFKGELKRVTTKDLVCWCYQVARGMQYLASRRIVHADLAARNILLADHNVVKICDFGLARNLYSEANYLKKGDDPLPVKWMAIESIQDRIFSTETDVWSYGIVLWEFFTLAKTPYPGIPLDEHFLGKLIEGYRMEKPQYSTLQIYKIMRKCWDINASKRPNFNELVNNMGQILDDNVKQFYLDLSGPYIRMNSLQQEYEKELRASMLPETSTEMAEMTQNVVTNPTYMLLPSGSQADNESSYINLEQPEQTLCVPDEPEGYLKMSPVPRRGETSTYVSQESSIHV